MSFNYFQSFENYFWQWEDELEVLSITDGNTIAYRVYIMRLLEKLAPQGLPPFGSLLLALIATNPNGRDHLNSIAYLKSESTSVEDAFLFLDILTELPAQFRESSNRILLFQMLFKDCHNINSAVETKKALRGFDLGTSQTDIYKTPKPCNKKILEADFRTIALLLKKFNSVDVILEKLKALPDFDETLTLENDISKEIAPKEERDYIEELIDNSRTFHVGSLVKRIWSGLNIPVHSSLPSQQPLGGISDLTNKGDFDKLLISEFANDDLIFLSRLANNEALYLQREIPPHNNDLERIILIDTSLKNWGTPKCMAFATLLAIAKHPKTNIKCSAYAIGKTFQPIVFDTVLGIIESLKILDGSIDASEGLNDFFHTYKDLKNKEVFIITEPSTLKSVGMLKATDEYKHLINYWIYTDAEGNIDVYKKLQKSKKHIQHIQLPLSELWRKEDVYKPSNRTIVSEDKFPLLFKTSNTPFKILDSSDGKIFKITREKTLFRAYDTSVKFKEQHWELLYENIPYSQDVEIGTNEEGENILLMFSGGSKKGHLLNIDTGKTVEFTLAEFQNYLPLNFIFKDGQFHHRSDSIKYSIDCGGKITENMITLTPEEIITRKETLNLLQNQYVNEVNILKNIVDVFINDTGNLVFNKHELLLNQGDHIILKNTKFLSQAHKAQKLNETEYEFSNGSRVEINRNGMIILKSNNDILPTIYIPSVIDTSLGVATPFQFAGKPYYYKYPLFDVHLLEIGAKSNIVIQAIEKQNIDFEKLIKEEKNGSPFIIQKAVSGDKAFDFKKELESLGAKVDIHKIKIQNQVFEGLEIISTRQFYKQHIEAFIENIQGVEMLSKPFTIRETNPEYPGGTQELFKFLNNSIIYPDEAKRLEIKGTVTVSFVVDTEGVIVETKIFQGVHPSIDNEALRVVQLMPRWQPGTQNGRKVRVSYKLPIKFSSY